MIRKLSVIVLVFAMAIGALCFAALRDNPGRPASGEPRHTSNQGVSLRYYTSGPADAEAVVLLASYARSGSDFNELVTAINRSGYRTVVLQARGIDGSELPSFDVTLFDFADDLAAVLDQEKVLLPITLIGHAYGNRIARAFASRYPSRVSSLVLLAAGDSGPQPSVRNDIFVTLVSFLPDSIRSRALHRAFFAPGNRAPNYWLVGWYPRAGLAQGRATASTPLAQWASGGSAPMLVVQPDNDAAAPDGGEKLKQLYPERVTTLGLENAGHAILPEQGAAIARIVLGHLASRKSGH